MVIDLPPIYQQQIEQLAKNQGLSVSEYVISLLPTQDYQPNAQTAESLRESIAERETSQRYTSIDEAMQDLQRFIHSH